MVQYNGIDIAHKFTRTWWQHTAKAVKRGEPSLRRFAVVGYSEEHRCLVAWKCEQLDTNGIHMFHPAYGACRGGFNQGWVCIKTGLAVDMFALESENDSRPTALFKHNDSLYVLCV